jgi:hypothetical protein
MTLSALARVVEFRSSIDRLTSTRANALDAKFRCRFTYLSKTGDSGSGITNFTMADESRYMTRSAVFTLAIQNDRRHFHVGVQVYRFGEWPHRLVGGPNFAQGPKLLQGTQLWNGTQQRHRTPPIGDLNGVAVLHQPQEFAGSLSELTNAH